MNLRATKATLATLLILCGVCWSQSAANRSIEAASVKTLDDLHQILVKNGFNVGYERNGPTQIDSQQGSGEDLLTFAGRVAREASHTLAFTGGSGVHIRPSQSEPSPFDSIIEKITFEDQSVDAAVREIGKQAKLPLHTFGLSRIADKRLINLTVKDVTVREALDQVMGAAKLGGWIANMSAPSDKPFIIVVQIKNAL